MVDPNVKELLFRPIRSVYLSPEVGGSDLRRVEFIAGIANYTKRTDDSVFSGGLLKLVRSGSADSCEREKADDDKNEDVPEEAVSPEELLKREFDNGYSTAMRECEERKAEEHRIMKSEIQESLVNILLTDISNSLKELHEQHKHYLDACLQSVKEAVFAIGEKLALSQISEGRINIIHKACEEVFARVEDSDRIHITVPEDIACQIKEILKKFDTVDVSGDGALSGIDFKIEVGDSRILFDFQSRAEEIKEQLDMVGSI